MVICVLLFILYKTCTKRRPEVRSGSRTTARDSTRRTAAEEASKLPPPMLFPALRPRQNWAVKPSHIRLPAKHAICTAHGGCLSTAQYLVHRSHRDNANSHIARPEPDRPAQSPAAAIRHLSGSPRDAGYTTGTAATSRGSRIPELLHCNTTARIHLATRTTRPAGRICGSTGVPKSGGCGYAQSPRTAWASV